MRKVLLYAGLSIAMGTHQTSLPDYVPSRHVSGTIHIWGSPQMARLLKLYEAGFKVMQPDVVFADDLKSTLTAVAGVYTGRADIGLLGREIWPTEVQAFTSIEGHAPTVIEVATGSFDVPKATFALMVFVPRSNPIASLSMAQLRRIFGNASPVRTWGELGLAGPWAGRPIRLYGFATDNDKAQIFSQLVFAQGERWNGDLHEFANQRNRDAGELILRSAAADPYSIAISNIHYADPDSGGPMRAVPIALSEGGPPIEPTRENVALRRYPLTRAVYMVVDSAPGHPPSAATVEFLRYVLSRQGQQAVAEEGNYLPLPPADAAAQLRQLPAR